MVHSESSSFFLLTEIGDRIEIEFSGGSLKRVGLLDVVKEDKRLIGVTGRWRQLIG